MFIKRLMKRLWQWFILIRMLRIIFILKILPRKSLSYSIIDVFLNICLPI